MSYIPRALEPDIKQRLFTGKAIIVYGPRQCGKTTMIRHITNEYADDVLWLNGDRSDVRSELDGVTIAKWKMILGKKKILVLDEAQRINQVGLALKLITDEIPDVQVIASGSSSFELADQAAEPLTGRKFEYHLLPLSFAEMCEANGLLAEKQMREQRLLFGAYPDVVTHPGDESRLLSELSNSYLLRDIYAIDGLRKSKILDNLVKALAMQIGSEVSVSELASLLSSDRKTVERYIDLLEKCYVVFTLPAYSRNLRNEIKKGKKIYFYDLGIRNAVMGNFVAPNSRTDLGGMWENYLILERLKATLNQPFPPRRFFWRTLGQGGKEVDYLEETATELSAWEIKSNPGSKAKLPLSFRNAYPDAKTALLTPDNYEEFVLPAQML